MSFEEFQYEVALTVLRASMPHETEVKYDKRITDQICSKVFHYVERLSSLNIEIEENELTNNLDCDE